MSTDLLQAELAGVVGVESADVDVADGTPAGVKVRLLPGADPRRVGVEVQRVLAAHGMRSRFPDGPPGATPPLFAPSEEPGEPPTDPAPPVGSAAGTAVAMGQTVAELAEVATVSMEEAADGTTTTVVLADGRRSSRRTSGDDPAGAIVDALLEAAGVAAVRLAVERLAMGDSEVVTVVLRRPDGTMSAGAAVGRLGSSYGVAAACRAALTS